MPRESPTTLKDLADLCQELASTTKRKEKTTILSEFLRTLSPGEIPVAINLIIGKPLQGLEGLTLEVGGATLYRVGDSGGQTTLTPSQLTLEAVAAVFQRMATVKGVKARTRRERLLQSLLSQASPLEREYLTRSILGDMRIGVVEGVMEEAVAKAANIPLKLVKKAHMLTGDLVEVARNAFTEGLGGLKSIGLQLFQPIKLMLAETSYDLEEVLREHKGEVSLEYKYDGARIQIHTSREKTVIYSRRLTDLTKSLPEVVETVRRFLKCDHALLDGEVVAIDDRNRPLPFQEVMRRLRRVHRVHELARKMPLQLHLFDLLLLDHKLLLDKPYSERRRLLEQISPPNLLATNLITQSVKEAREYLEEALRKGHEGVVVKALGSSYEPGIRGKNWIKIKPFESLDVVIVAAEWGHGRRGEWLSNYHLAVRDEEGGYAVIGKTFKGLTDQEFKELTEKLLRLKVGEAEGIVWVRPSIVVEVAYNELQRSPTYKSGYALRFARIIRVRWDKSVEEADSIDKVRRLYEEQFKYKGRLEQ